MKRYATHALSVALLGLMALAMMYGCKEPAAPDVVPLEIALVLEASNRLLAQEILQGDDDDPDKAPGDDDEPSMIGDDDSPTRVGAGDDDQPGMQAPGTPRGAGQGDDDMPEGGECLGVPYCVVRYTRDGDQVERCSDGCTSWWHVTRTIEGIEREQCFAVNPLKSMPCPW